MLTGSYRKRLEADLTAWVADGVISGEAAAAIRRKAAEGGEGIKLPAVLGMMGGLLLAASIAAFIAANWDIVPRVGKLAGVLSALVAAMLVSARFASRGAPLASDAAATCGALIFGAGVALVGQMYHLPADWPSGALLVGIGALAVAALMRSDGALVIAFIAGAAWLIGMMDQRSWMIITWSYLLFYLPAFALALSRRGWLVHNAAVLAGIIWLVLAVGEDAGRMDGAMLGTHIAYLLFVAVAFIALGLLADEGRLPPLFSACASWGFLGYVVVIALQLLRVLDASAAAPGFAATRVIISGVIAVGATALLLAWLSERKGAYAVSAALTAAMATSIVFWSGAGTLFAGRVIVAALVLLSAAAMVAAGAALGQRRVSIAGASAFGLAVLVLLWRTVGSLIDQSAFFLVGGVALLVIAGGMRRLIRHVNPSAKVAS